jgi:predicted Zn-ribbon and HTH transcriptional regulator
MNRPPLEVADLIRVAGQKFIEASRRWITGQHLKVLGAIERCRTAALGGHRDKCSRCGYRAISYNSCRNRHCPKCQAPARDQWLEARRQELLPTRYVHVVFTLPHRLAPLALQNKKLIYDLLFRTCAQTLLEVARDPHHLGAEIGFFAVLHSWNQKMEHHPHVHCVVPAGGLSPDHQRWIHPRYRFFLPRKVLGRVFRGKFVDALRQAFADGQLGFYGDLKLLAEAKAFSSFLRPLFRQDWVVYCKPPFGGPQHVLRYLGRYTHRVAISNHRLVSLEGDQVTFRWRDSAHGNQQRLMTLAVEEFLRRFLLHVLPTGFVRIRHFGFLAHRRRAALLPLCFQFLGRPTDWPAAPEPQPGEEGGCSTRQPSTSTWSCPQCGGPMIILERLTAAEMYLRSPPRSSARFS